jgi:hypothetical protein
MAARAGEAGGGQDRGGRRWPEQERAVAGVGKDGRRWIDLGEMEKKRKKKKKEKFEI